MADPTRKLEVAFTTTPFSTAPSWTDVTADVRSLNFSRGRSREQDQFNTATLQAVLDNRGRDYDPAASTDVKPMKRVRLSAIHGGSTYRLWDGYADSWRPSYDKPNDAVTELAASDGFKILAKKDLAESVYEQEVRADTPLFWTRFEESSDAQQVTDTIGGGTSGLHGGPTLGATGLRTLPAGSCIEFTDVSQFCQFTSSPLSGSQAWSIEFLMKDAALGGNPGGLVQILKSDGSSGLIIYVETTPSIALRVGTINMARSTVTLSDNATHHVVVTHDGSGGYKIYKDGSDVTSVLGSNVTDLSNGHILIGRPFQVYGTTYDCFVGFLDEVAIYGTALSAARVAAHADAASAAWDGDTTGERLGRILDAVDWPSSLRDIDAGDSTCQSTELGGGALDYVQKIGQTEEGLVFMAKDGKVRFISRSNSLDGASQGTFGDSGSDLRYAELTFDYEDESIANEVIVSRARGVAITAEDATSQAAYLKRSLTRDGLLHDSELESLYHAQFLLDQRKDPALRVTSMTILPQHDSTNLFPQVLGREVGDKVTVKRTPPGGGSAISQDCVIEGISFTVSAKFWSVTWQLSSVTTRAYWKLGTTGFSELGQTTRLGF